MWAIQIIITLFIIIKAFIIMVMEYILLIVLLPFLFYIYLVEKTKEKKAFKEVFRENRIKLLKAHSQKKG